MNLARAPLSMHAELMLQALLSLLVRTWKRHTDWSHPRIDINQELEWCIQGTVHTYPSMPHLNNITKPNRTSMTTSRQRKVGPVRCHLLTYHLQERLCIWPRWILLSNLRQPLGISETKHPRSAGFKQKHQGRGVCPVMSSQACAFETLKSCNILLKSMHNAQPKINDKFEG